MSNTSQAVLGPWSTTLDTTASDPISNPGLWDSITIGGAVSPGVCKVGKFNRKYKWDSKIGKGTIGATQTFVGTPPAEGTITFYLWTPNHFTEWGLFMPGLKYNPTKSAANAVDIHHPALALLDINSVIVRSIGSPYHEGGQLYSIEIDFEEYLPVPNQSAVSTIMMATATFSSTKGALGQGVGADSSSNSDIQAAENNLADAQATAAALQTSLAQQAASP